MSTQHELEALVRRRLAEQTGEEVAYGVGANEPFLTAGVDSVHLMHLVAQLEEDTGAEPVAEAELWAVATSVSSLVAYLAGTE
ncbi:acyl carrier protein [Nonomuraea longicatena]|uniref:Carrier domain-containing protein n=1 Tax=Nonomuraea longicatena TaxID=83682 RepID=A0ABP4AL94_9ACTN